MGRRGLEVLEDSEEDTCVLEGMEEAFALLAEIKG